jgi:hypothetical protein
VVLHGDDDVEVAGRTAGGAVLSFAVQPQTLSGGDAGRDLDRELAVTGDASGAMARRAGCGDDLARAAALGAGARDGEEALLISQLAAAVAGRAGARPRALGRPRSAAGVARLRAGDLDRGLGALRALLERDLEVVAKVGAALGPAAAARAAAEQIAEAENIAKTSEDVAEVGEYGWIESSAPAAAPTPA